MTSCHRIVLAIAYPASEAPVIAALHSAVPASSEVHVVYVEDRNLLRLAELSCAREIGGISARPDTTRRAELARVLQRHAAQIEIRISEALAERTAALHFEIVGGTIAAVALEHAQEADVTVLAQAVPHRYTSLADHWHPLHRRVTSSPLLALISSGTPTNLRTAQFAEQLGRASGHPLRWIQISTDASPPSPGTQTVRLEDSANLAKVVRRLRPWAIVASATIGATPVCTLARLGDAYEVGVFMVR